MESVAERMARFAQRHREEIAMYKAAGIGIEEVRILGVGKTNPCYEPCPACIALNGTIWPIEKCPPLPYSGCTNRQLGCRLLGARGPAAVTSLFPARLLGLKVRRSDDQARFIL